MGFIDTLELKDFFCVDLSISARASRVSRAGRAFASVCARRVRLAQKPVLPVARH